VKGLPAVVAGGPGNMTRMSAAIRTLRERLARPADIGQEGALGRVQGHRCRAHRKPDRAI